MTYYRDVPGVTVIGFSFRLPGGTDETLWQALLQGRDLVTSVDSDRCHHSSASERGRTGTAYTFAAGLIGDVAGFDVGFFSISSREAEQVDPQQRVLLEMALEAFESAGIDLLFWRN
jgi:phthiocerol/phenolphthiocerol synthesis type-I polyketide synthase C